MHHRPSARKLQHVTVPIRDIYLLLSYNNYIYVCHCHCSSYRFSLGQFLEVELTKYAMYSGLSYYYYYRRKLLRWHRIKRLQGHLTMSDTVTVQTNISEGPQ